MVRNLNDVYSSIEKLIQRTYAQKETDINFQLRNIRTNVSQLLSDIKNKELVGFSDRKGTLEDFYRTENNLLEESATVKDVFSSLVSPTKSIDIFLLEDLLENLKKDIDQRIIVDKNMLKEFKLKQMEAKSAEHVISGEKQISIETDDDASIPSQVKNIGRSSGSSSSSKNILAPSMNSGRIVSGEIKKNVEESINTEMLSKLYNYMNAQEHKYSIHQAEISFNGEYIGDKKWKVNKSDKFISGSIMNTVLKPLLTFETYWHPFDDLRTIMQFVQREANAVPKGQYKSICILNSEWKSDIKIWSQNYVHPRMILYLYNLENDELLFDKNVERADQLKVWHNLDTYITLENEILSLIEQTESFDAEDVAENTGLSINGAKKLISIMLSRNKIIDLGFGTSSYTGIKNK
ncbi:hypothetical protein V7O67_08165 [Methanolobus sp. ZRKC4]|uniref:hypothetical protein n=1 Tax=Methanolobus sp. ZRKC4 TaxID=3125787 RepID=UPI00324D4188